jgi:hypothetical protein
MPQDIYRNPDEGQDLRIRDLRREIEEHERSIAAHRDALPSAEVRRIERTREAVRAQEHDPHALIRALEEHRDLLERTARLIPHMEQALARVPRVAPEPETLSGGLRRSTRRFTGASLRGRLRFDLHERFQIVEWILCRQLEQRPVIFAVEEEMPLGRSAIGAKFLHHESPMALLWTWRFTEEWASGRLTVATSVPRALPDLQLRPRRPFSPLVRAILSGGRCIKSRHPEIDRRFDLVSRDESARAVVAGLWPSLERLTFFAPSLTVEDSVAELWWRCELPGRPEVGHAAAVLHALRLRGC